MKRIAIIVVMALMSLTASATSIRYFTYAQASRTVQYLNAQQEMMIYCGYDYEIETYVLINEVWMERINSAYYELWVYGYDAYTGDEIYMPLDLQCVWLYSAGRMYNAAQYLRFHATVRMPSFAWYVPPYNPYSRRIHAVGYVRSYHYDIHRHGWMPPTPPHHGYGPHTHPPLPPYYMRTPQTPPPAPAHTWTPGLEHPQVNNSGAQSNGPRSTGVVPTTRPSSSGAPSQSNTGAARSGNTRATETSTATPSRSTETRSTETRSTATESRSAGSTRSTGTTPTRSNTGTTRAAENDDNQEGTTATRSGGTRTSGTSTTSTTRSGDTRSTGTATGTTTRSGNTRATGTSSTTSRSTGSTSSSRSTSTRNTNTTVRK